jgi:hypothetical protein
MCTERAIQIANTNWIIVIFVQVGITRADRLMWTFFEAKNQRKSVIRLGGKDHGTVETEKLLHLNSYAHSLGYGVELLPFRDISVPADNHAEEFLGLSYRLPTTLHDVSNPTERAANDTNYDSDEDFGVPDDEASTDSVNSDWSNDDELADFLTDLYLDDEEEDIEVLFPEDELVEPTLEDIAQLEAEIHLLDVTETITRTDGINRRTIQEEVRKLLPEDTRKESTLQAFQRLTQQEGWLPFRTPGSTGRPTATDDAETRLFDNMKDNYIGQGKLGFKAFERDWNIEVARRFQLWLDGSEDFVQINAKTVKLLKDYHEQLNEQARLAIVAPVANCAHRKKVNEQFKRSRQSLPAHPAPHICGPTMYPPMAGACLPIGNPAALNNSIVAGAVLGYRPLTTMAPYIMGVPPPPPPQPPRLAPRKRFRSRRYCIVCGYRRSQHGDDENPGTGCVRVHCGNCHERSDCHVASDGWGPTCKKTPHVDSEKKEWYDLVV